MQRRTIITFAAAALLSASVLAPSAASARMWSGGHAFAPHVAFSHHFAGHDRLFFRDRFAFRHHVFPFRQHLAFAFADDGCFRLRHVWTRWGWTWRRVWVCD